MRPIIFGFPTPNNPVGLLVREIALWQCPSASTRRSSRPDGFRRSILPRHDDLKRAHATRKMNFSNLNSAPGPLYPDLRHGGAVSDIPDLH